MRTGNGQQVWIQGPRLKLPGRPNHPGNVMNGTFFNMTWKEGFSGPYSPGEAQRRIGSLSRARIVSENPWEVYDPEKVDKLIQDLKNAEVKITDLKAVVKDLEEKVVEGAISSEDPVFINHNNPGINGLARANLKKILMRKTGFDWNKLGSFKDGWDHYSVHVLPYVVK